MNMLIILRTKKNENLFRDIMINSIDSMNDKTAYLCSGFFQEFFKGSTYQVSTESNFDNILRNSKTKLITLGIYNNSWKPSYLYFIRNLERKGVNIEPYIVRGFKWHAKIFILEKNRKNILGIIGSSNLTRKAFSSDYPFNYECDVVLWDDSIKQLNSIILENLRKRDIKDVIKTTYLPKENLDLSIHERLEYIKNLFMDPEKLIRIEK